MATGRYDQQQPAMLLVIDKFSTNNQLYNKVQKFAARITLKANKFRFGGANRCKFNLTKFAVALFHFTSLTLKFIFNLIITVEVIPVMCFEVLAN